MKYTEEMILESESGFCMPFEAEEDVKVLLNYGKQKHPKTGDMFFHHGIDFGVKNHILAAIASGKVTGLGNDSVHGLYQVIRYGDYEVKYGHLKKVTVNYGQKVKAGDMVAISQKLLHLEVKYKGNELNPIEFLTMLYSNVKSAENLANQETPDFTTIELDIHTNYDSDKDEIEQLMLRFLPTYMEDLNVGAYRLPTATEHILRNIFTMSAMRHYFFEAIPSMANPLGLGKRSVPLAEKVQNLLIGDFLNYMALKHQIYLSTMSDALKKKHMTKQSHQAD